MLFEEEAFKVRLRGLIEGLGHDADLKEDIHQEVIIHLWQLERRFPQQNRSWYLQSCKFYAQHLFERGRSIDSLKRRSQRVPLPDDVDLADEILNPPETRNGLFFSEVSANNIEALLDGFLAPMEKKILTDLKEGYSIRQIARRLRVSHPAVLQRRKKIARLARRLGLGRSRTKTPTVNSAS